MIEIIQTEKEGLITVKVDDQMIEECKNIGIDVMKEIRNGIINSQKEIDEN